MSQGRYSVIRTNDCIVIEGELPVSDFVALTERWMQDHDGEKWMIDTLLTQHLGVNMVIGPPQACANWRERLGITPEGPPRPLNGVLQGSMPIGAKTPPAPRYRLVDGPGIKCLHCGRTSYNPEDVRHRFCANCDDFLEN
jgi:hypothetical protein